MEECRKQSNLQVRKASVEPREIFEQRNGSIDFLEFCKLHRHETILKEFESISENPIDGIYVFPSLKSLQIWYGVVFVSTGLYAEGIFHFKVILNDDYPFSLPRIRFDSNVFHPQVNPKGTLNIIYSISPNEHKGKIWNALKYTRDCFHNINQAACSNQNVLNIMTTNSDEFKALTRGCVLESLYELEERGTGGSNSDLEIDNPFNAKLLSTQICSTIKREFSSQELEDDTESEESLISWTKHTMGKMWNNFTSLNQNSLSHSNASPKKSPDRTLNGHSHL